MRFPPYSTRPGDYQSPLSVSSDSHRLSQKSPGAYFFKNYLVLLKNRSIHRRGGRNNLEKRILRNHICIFHFPIDYAFIQARLNGIAAIEKNRAIGHIFAVKRDLNSSGANHVARQHRDGREVFERCNASVEVEGFHFDFLGVVCFPSQYSTRFRRCQEKKRN